MPIDALSVLCAQLTRDLLAIAKFLYNVYKEMLHFITQRRPNKQFGFRKRQSKHYLIYSLI